MEKVILIFSDIFHTVNTIFFNVNTFSTPSLFRLFQKKLLCKDPFFSL